MSLFRNLLINNKRIKDSLKEEEIVEDGLYLIYNTSTLTNERIDFDSTSDMKAWIKSNYADLTGALSAVRQNVDDGFSDYSSFFGSTLDDSGETSCALNITSLDVTNFDITGATSTYYMFSELRFAERIVGLNNLDVSLVENMDSMFWACSLLTSLEVSSWDTSNVTTFYYMLGECESLTSLDLSTFNTANANTMGYMLNACTSLSYLNISGFSYDSEPYVGRMLAYLNANECNIIGFDDIPTTLEGYDTIWGVSYD